MGRSKIDGIFERIALQARLFSDGIPCCSRTLKYSYQRELDKTSRSGKFHRKFRFKIKTSE